MLISRRSVLRGLIAAPIVARAGLLMPVKAVPILEAPFHFLSVPVQFYSTHPTQVLITRITEWKSIGSMEWDANFS